jgi:ABC-type Na+ efflux pump permease subunit
MRGLIFIRIAIAIIIINSFVAFAIKERGDNPIIKLIRLIPPVAIVVALTEIIKESLREYFRK